MYQEQNKKLVADQTPQGIRTARTVAPQLHACRREEGKEGTVLRSTVGPVVGLQSQGSNIEWSPEKVNFLPLWCPCHVDHGRVVYIFSRTSRVPRRPKERRRAGPAAPRSWSVNLAGFSDYPWRAMGARQRLGQRTAGAQRRGQTRTTIGLRRGF